MMSDELILASHQPSRSHRELVFEALPGSINFQPLWRSRFELTRILKIGLGHRFSELIAHQKMSQIGRRVLKRIKN